MNTKNLVRHFSIGIAVIYLSLSFSSYSKESIIQTSHAPQSQNIVADTVNISGLSKDQTDNIHKQLKRLQDILYRIEKGSENARKSIENIDKELSKIQRENFDSLPEDAREWACEVRARLETFRERDSLIQESFKKQNEYRENLSHQMVVRLRDSFRGILGIIDSRALALQEEKDLSISYTRQKDFCLFVESGSSTELISLGGIRFKNGSSVEILLLPGTLVQGIAQRPPELHFMQVIEGHRSKAFSFKEKPASKTLIFGPRPLVPALTPKRAFNDVTFNPQKALGDTRKQEFKSTFTQFIGSVLSKDAVAPHLRYYNNLKGGEEERVRG